jgi:hypothetical protein
MCHAKILGEKLLELTNEIKQKLIDCNNQLSNIDVQISDVLHYIENENFNACQGFIYAKKLKELRLQRRRIKAEIEPLRMLNAVTSKNVQPLKCTLGNVVKKNEDLQKCIDEKKYIPRAITKEEIFLQ